MLVARKVSRCVANAFSTGSKVIWPRSSLKFTKMSKNALFAKSSRSQWVNKRVIPAVGKFTKYSNFSLFAICIFLKRLLLVICIFLSARCLQEKFDNCLCSNTLLAKTIRYPYIKIHVSLIEDYIA